MGQQRGTSVAVAASLGALLLAAPRPPAAVALLAGTAASADPTGPLVAAVALLAWAVTGWLALTVVLVLLSRLPGLVGRVVRVVVRRVAPAAVRSAVEAALGLTVVTGVLVPTAAVAAPVSGPSAVVSLRGDAGWDLDWPAATPAAVAPPTSRPASVAPGAPATTAATTPPRPTAVPGPGPSVAAPPTPRTAATAPASPSAVPPAQAVVVVRSGDSLWSVAQAALRRAGTDRPSAGQVAHAWPRWWAANREAVGDDPDLLLPGTVLRPPPDAGRS